MTTKRSVPKKSVPPKSQVSKRVQDIIRAHYPNAVIVEPEPRGPLHKVDGQTPPAPELVAWAHKLAAKHPKAAVEPLQEDGVVSVVVEVAPSGPARRRTLIIDPKSGEIVGSSG